MMDVFPADARSDPFAVDGRFTAADEHAQLLIVGAGPAGLAAATRAARLGAHVVLVDENPVSAGLMGLDVPLFYGQRMSASVQAPLRMIERLVASSPAIEAAFDAGVDVRFGHTVWGAFANGAALQALPIRLAGLSDGTKSWLCSFDALILATGARDLVLGFKGVDLPGVMGARALHSLLMRYDAFDGKRLVILGSGDLAADTAHAALDRGLAVTALVEVLPEPQTAPAVVASLSARGVEVLTNVTRMHAEPGAMSVSGLAVLCKDASVAEHLSCDTLCLAIDVVPTIELAGTLGCALAFRGDLGGHVPVTTSHGGSSLPGIFCVGDCAGVAPQPVCERQGADAAEAAWAWLHGCSADSQNPGLLSGIDTTEYRLAWMRMLLADDDSQTPVCMCEEVTRGELLGVSPPRYLDCTSSNMTGKSSTTLLADGPLNPDQIKRLTRAGMGVCQGRRCREQIALLLALSSDTPVSTIPLASYRAPVRPLPLGLLADPTAQPAWDVWFGIRTQWIPYDMIDTPAEAAILAAGQGGNMHA